MPLLPTTVIGSYSMPEWLERAKNDYLSRASEPPRPRRDARRGPQGGDQGSGDRRRRHRLRRRAAARQHDRLLRRAACPACRSISGRSASTTTSTRASCARSWRPGRSGLSEEVRFLRRFTERASKVSISGPHTLVKRIQNQYYPSEEAFALDLGARAEPRAARAGARRRHRPADRRAVLLGLSRGSAVGDQGDQRDGRRRGRAHHAAHLLRQPLRQAVVGGQLPVSVPGDPRGEGARRLARVRAARRRGPAAVQGVQRAVHARPRRHRRQDPGRRVAGASWPTASAGRSRSCRPSGS